MSEDQDTTASRLKTLGVIGAFGLMIVIGKCFKR